MIEWIKTNSDILESPEMDETQAEQNKVVVQTTIRVGSKPNQIGPK